MQTRVTTIAFSASCASIAALVALAGCSGSGMDRRIADLTREQSLRLRQELDGPTVPVVASGRAPGEARWGNCAVSIFATSTVTAFSLCPDTLRADVTHAHALNACLQKCS